MLAANTGERVLPDTRGTRLVYTPEQRSYTAPYVYAILFLCTANNSQDTRFLYAWHKKNMNKKWRWYIGAPYLSVKGLDNVPVLLSKENITSQVRDNSVPELESTFRSMLPFTPFNNAMFVWSRSSSDDDNFQVSKKPNESQLYWRAEERTSAVTLTGREAQGGRFEFTQI